jgi:hypothetical protein
MKRLIGGTLLVGFAGASAVGAGLAKRLMSRNGGMPGSRDARNRWLMVTVNCPLEQFPAPDDLPEPARELAADAEFIIQPAAGNRGTEFGMRLREQPSAAATSVAARILGKDPRQRIRSALREVKSLIETGEVLIPDEPTTHPTPAGKVLDLAAKRAYGEGRL